MLVAWLTEYQTRIYSPISGPPDGAAGCPSVLLEALLGGGRPEEILLAGGIEERCGEMLGSPSVHPSSSNSSLKGVSILKPYQYKSMFKVYTSRVYLEISNKDRRA